MSEQTNPISNPTQQTPQSVVPQKKRSARKMLFLGLLLLVVGAGGLLVNNAGFLNKSNEEPSPRYTEPTKPFFSDFENYTYSLVRLSEQFDADAYYDNKLVATHKTTGAQEVLVGSTKTMLEELKAQKALMLVEYAFPQGSPKLYFISVIANSDAPPRGLYAFDLRVGKFNRLGVLAPYLTAQGTAVLSSDKDKVVSTIDPEQGSKYQKLFLLDLNQNTVSTIVTLSGNETLNYCDTGCLGDNAGNIKWVGGNTIEYYVYDSSRVENIGPGATEHPLIEKRTITVQ